MKIDLEQIYTLQFTMGLRYRPMQIRHNIKLLLVALLFFSWVQGDFMNGLPGNLSMFRVDMSLIVILGICFIILNPTKLAIRFQNSQYLLYIFCFQWLILLLIRFFYFSMFYFFQNKVSLTNQTITKAYVLLFVLWIAVFIVCCFRFRKKLRKGDFSKDSALQNKRGNLGLKLSKKAYISIGAFFAFILLSQLIGGVMIYVLFISIAVLCMALSFLGLVIFPEQLFTAYCKSKFKEFHIEE
ncbi:hypothetical protein [Listeria monocytogenes]|uniref:hypothetical protein n=1 Tax=Listeria monocytogenes TaxID=1639 RepID=UPI0008759028|nr:hypothetical protein [Listeria monocytogenes]OFH52313.1 hypothetical protein BJN07_08985 [Listeria monocytogenes]